MEWYWIIVFIMGYKFIDNLIKYRKCISLKNRYIDFCMNSSGVNELLQSKKSVSDLILGAGVCNYIIPWTQPAGYGLINTMQPSTLSQFPSNLEIFARSTLRMFEEAIGIYRSRMWETFSPIYWVQCVVFLPKKLLIYIGASPESVIIKLSQVFWWFICLVGSVTLTLFRETISTIVKKFLVNF